MTGLLISVRSAAEAQVALAGGTDLIDVKEPRRGSLGAAEPQVWADVLATVGGEVPVSAALGELLVDFRWTSLQHAQGLRFAKVGLAGCADVDDWATRWTRAMCSLPTGVQPVAVTYADRLAAHSPAADEILSIAARIYSPYLLVDTFDKASGPLLHHLTMDALTALADRARAHDMRLVLAGSLDESAIRRLAPLAPAYFAVRGAACGGARTQAIELARVKRLATIVQTSVTGLGQEVA